MIFPPYMSVGSRTFLSQKCGMFGRNEKALQMKELKQWETKMKQNHPKTNKKIYSQNPTEKPGQ